MLIRLLIVCIFFIALPLVGVVLQLVGDYTLLTKWDYVNVFLSVSFSSAFITKSYNFAKILGGLLFISIMWQEANELLFDGEEFFSAIIPSIFVMIYKLVMGFLIFLYLLMPTFKVNLNLDSTNNCNSRS